ncbi:hypothetical protein F4819DRAFT_220244 [Hypoxylon fuscum]|nr:hypothetical protein F4819DRAFT_220244 [Hypoxylon fuscum]
MSNPEQQVFPFFKLPPELRLMVYRLVIQKDHPLRINRKRGRDVTVRVDKNKLAQFQSKPRSSPPIRNHTALLYVSKKMYAETTPVLFANSILVMNFYGRSPHAQLNRIGDHVRHINRLVLWIDEDDPTVRSIYNSWQQLRSALRRTPAITHITLLFCTTCCHNYLIIQLAYSHTYLCRAIIDDERGGKRKMDFTFIKRLEHAFNARAGGINQQLNRIA